VVGGVMITTGGDVVGTLSTAVESSGAV